MDRGLQHAYSRQASVEFEQQLGARTTVSAGYQYVRGVDLLMQMNQNVPSCLPSGANNGCRPNAALRQQQPVLVGGGVVVPRPAGVARGPAGVVGPGARELHAVEIDEQRGRGVLQLADRSARSRRRTGAGPTTISATGSSWTGRIGCRTVAARAGGRASPAGSSSAVCCSTYSALPFNITSGVTTLQGTAGRPIVDGRSSHATPGGQRLLQRRRARVADLRGGPRPHRRAGRGVQPHQPAERAHPERHVRVRQLSRPTRFRRSTR